MMARIPLAVSLLSQVGARSLEDPGTVSLQNLLIAAILHAEDDVITITESELHSAGNYKLVVTVIEEEGAVALTVRPR